MNIAGLSRPVGCPLAILLLASVSGCAAQSSPTASTKTEPKPIPVRTVSVTERAIPRTTTQPATVYPYFRAEIRPRVSGYVADLEADIGDVVGAGDVLAIVDVPEMLEQRNIIDARIARNQAREQQATAGVTLAQANVKSAESRLGQAESEVHRAKAHLAAADAEFTRIDDLVKRQSLESRMLDESRKKRDGDRASLKAVTSAIEAARADVGVAKANELSAQADLQAARSETAISESQRKEIDVLIGYATIRAPFDGIVTERTIDPGDLVTVNQDDRKGKPLFVISQVDRVRVHVPVPEAEAAFVNPGDPVTLTFPSFSGEKAIDASVTRLAHALDPSTRTMLVEVEVPNPRRKLIPGLFGQATITLESRASANVLPARAVRFSEQGQAYVYVVGDDETVSIAEVTTGHDDGQTIQIVSGVEKDAQVIDAHLKRFTDGQRVRRLEN
ncbi:Multidrug resistance protein MdtA precursor [Planctomycetes bacterium Pan216]|uniref:Multidrug resistance protein MdtA n=1 Tax=Kolteria novifilia TaxID=2527975 RepID=A0A518B7U1_9BACT|nr:Multidrug resistance protein MdtA precursor [Planctomycetes bacterium Pan216]